MITRLKKIKIRIYNLFVVFLIYLSEKVALLLTKWNEKRNPNLFCNSQKKISHESDILVSGGKAMIFRCRTLPGFKLRHFKALENGLSLQSQRGSQFA